jgi:FKBP-type peptidyl-prolyl cis-trans isomerase (trigger factor)
MAKKTSVDTTKTPTLTTPENNIVVTVVDAYTAKATQTVPLAEYNKFRERLIDQLRATVSVPGFRPGKVPAAMADAELDPAKVESIVQQETIQKFGNNTIINFVAELKELGKQGIGFDVSVNGEGLGLTDKGYTFELTATTLPDIKLASDTVIKVSEVEDKDIPANFPDVVTYLKDRKIKLLEMVNQPGEDGKAPEKLATKFEEIADVNPLYGQIFGDEAKFDETYTQTWESEKIQVKKNIKQTRVIQALLDMVPEFELQTSVVESEIDRITKSVLEDVKENGKTIAEIVEIIGMPNPKKIVAKTEKELKEIVTNYVTNEMRLMWILRKVYEDFVVTKPTQDEIDKLAKDMETKSEQYNVPKNLPIEQYQDMAFDRAMRGTAYDIIAGWVVTA